MSLPRRRLLTCAVVLAWALPLCWALPTMAQLKLPGLGGGGDQPAVRLADDPRQEVTAARKALAERQQALALHATEVEGWKKRQAEVRGRIRELRAVRETLVRSEPPTPAERVWARGAMVAPEPEPEPEPPAPDAGLTDAGAADAGAPDAGPGDAAALPPPEPPPVPPQPTPGETLLPVLKTADEAAFLAPGVHPTLVHEIDAVIAALTAIDETLAATQRVHSEERSHITVGIADADQLLTELEEGRRAAGAQAEQLPGLKEAEQLGLARYRARIDLSQARARQRSPREDEGAVEEDIARLSLLPDLRPLETLDLEPWAAYSASYAQAEAYRAEQERLRREVNERRANLAALRGPLQQSRARRLKLDLMLAERELSEREQAFQQALDRLHIDDEVLEEAQARYDRSVELRKKAMPALQEKLDQLRSKAAAVGDEGGFFSTAKLLEVQDMLVSEEIDFEKLKLERDGFEVDLARQLQRVLRGQPPAEEFRERYAHILAPDRLEEAKRNLETRCDGWRRGRHDARREKAPPTLAENRTKILAAYDELADLCMREGWVYGTQERFAEIANYHFERFEKDSRGVWWYLWRGLVSLLFAVATFLVSRGIGRLTHRLGGHRSGEEAGSPRPAPAPAPTNRLAALWSRFRKVRSMVALSTFVSSVLALWIGMILLVADLVWDFPLALASLLGWATKPIFVLGDGGVSLWSLAQVGLWTLCAIWVARALQSFVSDLLEHFDVERGLRDTGGTITRYVVILAGLALGLSSVGIGLGALAVVFGVIGIGIGFGLQSIAQNFIGGFIILLERPIRKGDFVQVGDMVGEVRDINARATTIETRDAVTLIVPNAEFIGNRVINWTQGADERVRTQVNVRVAYRSDVQLVRRLLLEVGRTHPQVLPWPPPNVQLVRFGENSLDFVLHVWTTDIRNLPNMVSDLNLGVDAAFRANGIQIPFPQRDLHIKEPPPAATPARPEADDEDEPAPAN